MEQQAQVKSGRKGTCPEHGEVLLLEEYVPIKTGIDLVVRKVIHVGKCPVDKCTRWCEIFLDYVLWA